MNKYLTIFNVTIKEYFAYRLSFVLWRFRTLINLIVIFFFWFAVSAKYTNFAGYSQPALLSYILYASLISDFVIGTRLGDIAAEINNGNIINIILKPIGFFNYYFARDLADKFINIVFSFGEILIVAYIARISLSTPQNLILFVLFFLCGLMISYYMNLIIAFLGFWTTESWAPRFIFTILISLLSGNFFPLDMLPKTLYQIALLTPIPYLFFLPTKIILGRIDNYLILEAMMAFFWLLISRSIAHFIWKKGNKSFSFWGR